MEGDTQPLDRDAVRGILARGGTILGTSRKDPYVHGEGFESCRRTIEQNGIEGSHRHRRRRNAPLGAATPRGRASDRRGAEDDRQRHPRHRHDLRLRHGGERRDGGDRPADDDGRVPQPGHGRRGDGPHPRLDRHATRQSQAAQTRAHSRAAVRLEDVARHPEDAPPARAHLLDRRGRRRGRATSGRRAEQARLDAFGFERLGESRTRSRRRSRS